MAYENIETSYSLYPSQEMIDQSFLLLHSILQIYPLNININIQLQVILNRTVTLS